VGRVWLASGRCQCKTLLRIVAPDKTLISRSRAATEFPASGTHSTDIWIYFITDMDQSSSDIKFFNVNIYRVTLFFKLLSGTQRVSETVVFSKTFKRVTTRKQNWPVLITLLSSLREFYLVLKLTSTRTSGNNLVTYTTVIFCIDLIQYM